MVINVIYKRSVSKEALKLSPIHPKWYPDHIRKKYADGSIIIRPLPKVR